MTPPTLGSAIAARRGVSRLPRLVFPAFVAIFAFAFAPSALAATWYVDRANPACSDSGPGTEAVPYCTINAAHAAHYGPGVTIAVKPGVYDEVVGIKRAGAAGSPFVLQATAPGVVLNGHIHMSARPWVTIDGFTVNAIGGTGIFVGSSSNAVITNNTVLTTTGPSNYGIYVSYAVNQLIAGNTVAHGENSGFVIRSVSSSVIENNVSHHNDVGFNFKVDNGPTTGNVIRRNRAHSNRSSGFYYQSGVDGNLALQNLAWSNGENGIRHVWSRGNRHIGEVIWNNLDDGVSVRQSSTGNSFENCILEGSGAYEVLVDSSSTAGWSSDDNVYWNSAARVFHFGGVAYRNLQSMRAATGNDLRSRQEWPRLLDPANGDFRVMQGSPAIDCANSSIADWPAADFDGHAPVDDPAISNLGLGSVDFADRGAFEFAPVGTPPVARVQALPGAGFEYVIDASPSWDLDGPILWYWFSFGDGWVSGPPQTAPSVTHTYLPGTWTAKVTIVDASGYMAFDSTRITVGGVAGVEPATGGDFALGAMTPNPVAGAGRFAFTVPRAAPVRIRVLDLQGRAIATLVDRLCEAGRHEAVWDGAASHATQPGLYFLRLEAPGVSATRRFTIRR